MVSILPFRKTSELISETNEFLDTLGEAFLIVERTFSHYLEHGPDDELGERVEQILKAETRCDELRRNLANILYTEMLMPDARGDIMSLGALLDDLLDDSVHLLTRLFMERPEIPEVHRAGFRAVLAEAVRSTDDLLRAVRAYFTEPHTVRDHLHKIAFSQNEATGIAMRTGREIFESDMPLAEKCQLRDWIAELREISSGAEDVSDQLVIFALKRAT